MFKWGRRGSHPGGDTAARGDRIVTHCLAKYRKQESVLVKQTGASRNCQTAKFARGKLSPFTVAVLEERLHSADVAVVDLERKLPLHRAFVQIDTPMSHRAIYTISTREYELPEVCL